MVHEKSRLQGFQKTYVGRLFSGYLKYPLSWGFLRVLGAWMTFKKADMAKTLKTRFSMIETNPLNHKWLDFVILTGLVLHQFQTKWLLSTYLKCFDISCRCWFSSSSGSHGLSLSLYRQWRGARCQCLWTFGKKCTPAL